MNTNFEGKGDGFTITSQAEFDELVVRGRGGDASAVATLIAKYRNYLLMIANHDLDPRIQSKVGASDVVQQTMIRAQDKFEQFRGATERELLGWLKAALTNNLKNQRQFFFAKKRSAANEVSQQDQSTAQRNARDPHLTPRSDILKQEQISALAMEISKLPIDYQTVIELRNFEQMKFKEIGEQMNRSQDAVCKLWARAIETLQARLESRLPGLFSGLFDQGSYDE